jgi:hypothetical protein
LSRSKQTNCAYCGKENLSGDVIGLNKKLVGLTAERMMCLTCMAEDLETTEEELLEFVERFKREGCKLFG